jgi:hypothetical protein
MLSTWKKTLAVLIFAGLCAIAAPLKTAIAAGQSATPAAAPAPTMVAAGTPEAVQLLKLMDTDKNGKISHAEYSAFMEAEFQRLDLDHDGQLDLKELEKSQLAVAHHGGTRR